jgi:hypothetical protein
LLARPVFHIDTTNIGIIFYTTKFLYKKNNLFFIDFYLVEWNKFIIFDKTNKSIMEKTIRFRATGFVLGAYWGGGAGAYPTISFEADSKEALLEQANVALANGSIDSGMGFESLVGAVLTVTKETVIEFEGDEYVNEKLSLDYIGDMTEEQISFLEEFCLHIC